MLDDAHLLLRYVSEKSDTAFAELVERHVDLVYSAALRQVGGDAHRARDVAQLVFTALARKAPQLTTHPALAGWLYITTQHVARRTVLAEVRRRAREVEAGRMNGEADSGPAAWESIGPVLDEAMRELGERDREAVVLRFFSRQPFAEIGRLLGVSEDAARMRVDRALDRLRGALARRGVTSTATALSLALPHAVGAAPAGLATGMASTALATAGASPLPAAVLFHFMTTSKTVLSGTAVAALLALSAGFYEWSAAQRESAAMAEMRAQTAALRAQQETLASQALAAAQLKVPTPARADASPARVAALRQAAAERAAALDAGDAFLARHHELRQVAIDYRRANIAGNFGGLFKLLRLSSAEIERFKDLALSGINNELTGPNGEKLRYRLGGDRAEAEAELQQMLGPEGFDLYKNYYEKVGPAWQTTIQLAGDLAATPSPLTADQAGEILPILIEGRTISAESPRRQYDWSAIMARAQAVLTAAQLQALDDLSTHDKFSQGLQRSTRRQSETKE